MADQQKIAFLCHPYHRGGVTRWMADAAVALSNSGHEVFFVTVEPKQPFFSAGGREPLLQLLAKTPNNVRIIKVPAGSEFEFGTMEYRAYVYQKLIAQIPRGTPLILSDTPAVWKAATDMQASYPVVGVLHADEDHYYNLAEKYFAKVDIFVCVSNRISRTLRARIPSLRETQTYIIPCGINLPLYSPKHRDGDLQLVYVGRISNFQKRTGDLLKIAEALRAEAVRFHLNIIGDGDSRKELEQQCVSKALEDHVTFTGWLSQNEVAARLSESDILLLTSDFEGTPIAMMEALAAGVCVVGTRVSGIEDYEFHPLAADCFSVFAVGDIAAAVEKIKRLAAIPAEARSAAARQLAEQEFSLQSCLSRYSEALSAIHGRSGHAIPAGFPPSKLIYSRVLSFARHIKVRFSR